jgi:16S rRNA processing protein RimM
LCRFVKIFLCQAIVILFKVRCVALLYIHIATHLLKSTLTVFSSLQNTPLGEGGIMPEYFKIGKFVATHGLKGDLVLKHELGKKTSLKGLQTIFIEERKNSFLPWFIESAKIKNAQEIFLKLEGVATREAALKLAQKEVWFAQADLKKFAAKSSPVNLLGYTVIDEKNSLGEIVEVIEQAHQMLCRIEINKKEVLIPLNDDTLQKIDHKKKEVIVKLPEGLLEIYLDL